MAPQTTWRKQHCPSPTKILEGGANRAEYVSTGSTFQLCECRIWAKNRRSLTRIARTLFNTDRTLFNTDRTLFNTDRTLFNTGRTHAL